MYRHLLTGAALLVAAHTALAMNVDALWDYDKPAVSEQRFRAALATAQGDDALILQTQIARTYGLRHDFARARNLLNSIRAKVQHAGAEARARYALELGRTYSSATHPPKSQTPQAKQIARASYERALSIARAAHLDRLQIDALHMLAFVDTAPADQLKWARRSLAVVESSSQPAAKAWEASIRNNLGYVLHETGHYEEALSEFRKAAAIRERGHDAEATRIAHWMVAWTLRALGRTDEALAMQQQLEREWAAAGQPDRYVFEELELLYRQRGDQAQAEKYAALKNALPK
jgi:tetratricopeptide (TPR) repeat protein